jgi:hypothetical protein
MSDSEFKHAIRDNLKKIIDQKKKGAKIRWNKDIVKYAEVFAPDQVGEIKRQIATDNLGQTRGIIVRKTTPGAEDETWVIYNYNLDGIKLYGFYQHIIWAWNSSQITSVSTSAYSHIWAPLWVYNGVNDESGQYNNNHHSYTKYHEGHFSGEIGCLVTHTYLWLQTTVMTGGGWSHNEGFN